jgi:hypothetical protein
MSALQNIARHFLPETAYNAIRAESQCWLMRCPCGHETSVWEMGGLRWKADGKPIRWGRCGACGERYFGQAYRRQSTSDLQSTSNGSNGSSETMNQMVHNREIRLDQPGTKVRLWIDGVGCWLLCPGKRVTLGGPVEPGSSQPSADLCLLASLRRHHATFERLGEAYRLETREGQVNSRAVRDETFLSSGDVVTLGQNVRMRFRQPSVLSASAVLTPEMQAWPRMFTAGQTPGSVDGVVLFDEVCLLGPGSDAHIACRDWSETVILHRRDAGLWCRTSARAQIDSRTLHEAAPLSDGVLVSGDGWRFRVEVLESERNRSV